MASAAHTQPIIAAPMPLVMWSQLNLTWAKLFKFNSR
jgi:hypothetical protein